MKTNFFETWYCPYGHKTSFPEKPTYPCGDCGSTDWERAVIYEWEIDPANYYGS